MQIPISSTLPRLSRLLSQVHQPSLLQLRTYTTPVLAKPTKFTPPSHPPSPPRSRDPINYPGPPRKHDPTKRYPNTMPPPGTWSHYILTSRALHFYISLSILLILGTWASVTNFLRTTDRGRELEEDLSWARPIEGARRFVNAYRLHAAERSLVVAEMRRRKAEDMQKRGAYRRAHGLEQVDGQGGFGGWGVRRHDVREDSGVVGGESPTGGEGGWVEEEIRKAEKEAEKTADVTGEKVVVKGEEVQGNSENKKGSWWPRG